MPQQFNASTFASTYKDDFLDSAGYHKVLFNSGRALQARELTQLQTILQTQITRFARNIFLDGAAVNPKSSGAGVSNMQYVILEDLPNDADLYPGTTWTGSAKTGTGGLKFVIQHVEQASGGDLPTIYGRYIDAGQSGTSTDVQTDYLTFDEAEVLTSPGLGDITVRTKLPGEPDVTGEGTLFYLQGADFFVQGHFVFAPKQQIAIAKYTPFADADVGFEVVQDIVTVADDEALYDNQGARPNLSSPGADRYRIRLLLTTRSSIANELDFLPFATVRDGIIIQIKEGTDSFNQVEKRLARRQQETTGRFIVNPFEIEINEKDSATLTYIIPGKNQFGQNPLAYLDGYRLEHQIPAEIDVAKPVSFTADSGMLTPISYKNYVSVRADSAGASFLGAYAGGDMDAQKKHRLSKADGTILGDARIKSIRNTGFADSDRYRIHLYDIRMLSGQNFRNVNFIGEHDSATGKGIRVHQEDNQTYVVDPNNNTSLFEIPGYRTKAVSDVRYTVQRQFNATTDGSGALSINTGNDENFSDEGQWTFINLDTDTVDEIAAGSITITGGSGGSPANASIATTGGASANYVVYAYVEKGLGAGGLAAKTKTYREDWFTATRVNDSVGDRFLFTLKGGTALSNMYDGVELLEAYDSDSTGPSVKFSLEFDGGQRDNYYGPANLIPAGVSSTTTTVRAKVGYFEWGASGHYFSANSYDLTDSTWFDYGDIPTYVSKTTGTSYALHNYFDFRSKLDPLSDTMATTNWFEIPRDGDQISHGVQYYNQRIDSIVLSYNAEKLLPVIRVNQGVEHVQPTVPSERPNEMVLYSTMLGGNTKNVGDIDIRRNRYPRFTMRDIDDLRARVERVEETVALSFIEQEAQNLVEVNSSGQVRSKTGFFVDDFTKGLAMTASVVGPTFIDDATFITQTLDARISTVQPKSASEWVELLYDSDNLYSARAGGANSNIVRKGDLLMLDYTEVLDSTLSQPVISWLSDGRSYEERGYYNVNPFNVFRGEGLLKINPSVDAWTDTKRLPDKYISGEPKTVFRNTIRPLAPITTSATRTHARYAGGWTATGNWRERKIWTGTSWVKHGRFSEFTNTINEVWRVDFIRQKRTETVVDNFTEISSETDRKLAVVSIPWMRQKRIFGRAQGLRPNTRYWPFFADIPVSQWVLSMTETEYKSAIGSGLHHVNHPSADVTLKKHPATSGVTTNTLISDARGDLWFDFWLPNTAPVPIPNSATFDFQKEIRSYQAKVRKGVQLHGTNQAAVYDYAGWKFRTGLREMKLLDISANNEEDALSVARTLFNSTGKLEIKQREIITSRVTVMEHGTEDVITSHTTAKTRTVTRWRAHDPLAQTFSVDAQLNVPGVFVTKVDVFLRSAPAPSKPQIPIQLQIRGVRDGTPMNSPASEQHRVYVSAPDAYAIVNGITDKEDYEEVLANPVPFVFEEPVFLPSGQEFAIVLLAECDDYQAFVGTTYDLILGRTDKRVAKQPANGSLFLSQNGSTWTPKQNQDLAYRIHTAKFKSSGKANFFNQIPERHQHNFNTSLSVDSDDLTRFRVTHPNHNLGVGDVVRMTGLDSAASYLGVTGANIMNSANVVDSADVNGYYVSLPSGTFTGRGSFGADSVRTNKAFNIDRFTLVATDIVLTETDLDYEGSFVSGVSHSRIGATATADPRFDVDDAATPLTNSSGMIPLSNKEMFFFNTPRYYANSDQQVNSLSGAPSIVISANMSSSQTSLFGGPKAAAAVSSGYVSDVTPIIDIQQVGAETINYVIDNQAVDSASRNDLVNNAPSDFVPETHPILGTTPSKHLTKPITLTQAANGLKVILNMHKPPSADFELYYRVVSGSDEDIYNASFIRVDADNNPPDANYGFDDLDVSFQEYQYLIGGLDGSLDDFIQFQLKIVFKSTNTCEIPILRDIKAIALI